jgi:hypothetical protein
METIKSNFRPLVIACIIFLVIFLIRRGNRKTIAKPDPEPVVISPDIEPEEILESDREPIKRDFNNLDSLLTELDITQESTEIKK